VNEAVYLVPIGAARFELYTEPPEDARPGLAHDPPGYWSSKIHRLHQRWEAAARAAQEAPAAGSGRLAHGRDWVVRKIAESIAEQRTLWSLRRLTSSAFFYPADLSQAVAEDARQTLLTRARRHHGWWLLANLGGVAVTAVLVLLPGPNLIGYYFAFRLVGHFLSWRGARQALDHTSWRPCPEPALTELGALAAHHRDERAERVASIAARLELPRLPVFFDRLTAPDR
jgi:hypothetical protein